MIPRLFELMARGGENATAEAGGMTAEQQEAVNAMAGASASAAGPLAPLAALLFHAGAQGQQPQQATQQGQPPQPEGEAPQPQPAGASPSPTSGEIVSDAQRSTEQDLQRLEGAEVPSAPHMQQVALDDRDRFLIGLVQVATGDTALAGAFAEKLLEDKTRQAEIEFKNALLDYEVEKSKYQAFRENTILGINSRMAFLEQRLKGELADRSFELEKNQLDLEAKKIDATITAIKEQAKASLWERSKPIIEAVLSPTTPPEEKERLSQYLTSTGVISLDALQALAASQDSSARFLGIIDGVNNIKKEFYGSMEAYLRAGVLPENVADQYNQRLQDINGQLSDEERNLLQKISPETYSLLNNGFNLSALSPLKVDEDAVAYAFMQDVFNRDTLDISVVQSLMNMPPDAKKVILEDIAHSAEQWGGGGASTSLIVNVLRQTAAGEPVDISALSDEERRALAKIGPLVRGIHFPVIARWLMTKTGYGSPITLAIQRTKDPSDPRNGKLVVLKPDMAERMWASYMQDASTLVVDDIAYDPAIVSISMALNKGVGARLVNKGGNWYVYTARALTNDEREQTEKATNSLNKVIGGEGEKK